MSEDIKAGQPALLRQVRSLIGMLVIGKALLAGNFQSQQGQYGIYRSH